MKNLVTMTVVLAVACSVALAVPVYNVLHQSDGTAVDGPPVDGYMNYLIDNSGNGNHLYSQNTIGVPNDIGGMTRLSTDGPAGVGDAYTRTRNGGTTGTNALVDLQTPEFCWEMDLRFEPNAMNAGQGGIGAGTHIIGTKYNEHGEGVSMNANADGSLSAHLSAYIIGTTITTAPGLVTDDVWVNVCLSFEGVTDGGLFERPEWAPPDWVSDQRQIWAGTLKIYVNGVEEASGAGGLILNDDGYGPFLGAWGPTPLGFTPNLGFDNVRISGIPEPATMSLIALGGLALLRRRRK